jgi:hypothetical protein
MVTTGEWSRRLDRVETTAVVRGLVLASERSDIATLLLPTRGRTLPDPTLSLEVTDGGAAVARFRLDSAIAAHFDLDSEPPVVSLDTL